LVSGGNMTSKPIKWKVAFFIILALVLASVSESATVPEIIAPTHPVWVSICAFILDLVILLGAYNYAYGKKIGSNRLLWQLSLWLFYIINLVIVAFEFYNRANGYEVYDMVHIVIFKSLIVFFLSYPTYRYYSIDLKQA